MTPQSTLSDFGPDLSDLTEAEYEVYMAVENCGYGPREYASETNRSPGTVGNLLRRARDRLGEGGGS